LAHGWWCKNPCMDLVRLPQQCKDDHLVNTILILITLDYMNYLRMINTSMPTIITNSITTKINKQLVLLMTICGSW
jgi:hypothetical protein